MTIPFPFNSRLRYNVDDFRFMHFLKKRNHAESAFLFVNIIFIRQPGYYFLYPDWLFYDILYTCRDGI